MHALPSAPTSPDSPHAVVMPVSHERTTVEEPIRRVLAPRERIAFMVIADGPRALIG